MLFVLCVLAGIYLLVVAPEFFMPARDVREPGYLFSPGAARALGGGLLSFAAMGVIYLRHQYYSEERRLPEPAVQKLYFALTVLGLGLMTLALNLAEPAPPPPPVQSESPAP